MERNNREREQSLNLASFMQERVMYHVILVLGDGQILPLLLSIAKAAPGVLHPFLCLQYKGETDQLERVH